MRDYSGKKNKLVGTISLIVMSLVCAVMGATLLFIPEMNERVISYIMCGGLVVFGIVQFSRFFATEAYHKLHDYSFSSGALFVILGCCGLARTEDICQQIDAFFGLLLLVLGVIMLQNAVQLKASQGKSWVLQLIGALVGLFCAVIVLARVGMILKPFPSFTYWAMLILGLWNAVSFLAVSGRVNRYQKMVEVQETVIDAAKSIKIDEALPGESVQEAIVIEQQNPVLQQVRREEASGEKNEK